MSQLEDAVLLRDVDVARKAAMSREWVRNQRWRRRNGHQHVFTVDCVMVGARTPRYRLSDVEAWLAELSPANNNQGVRHDS